MKITLLNFIYWAIFKIIPLKLLSRHLCSRRNRLHSSCFILRLRKIIHTITIILLLPRRIPILIHLHPKRIIIIHILSSHSYMRSSRIGFIYFWVCKLCYSSMHLEMRGHFLNVRGQYCSVVDSSYFILSSFLCFLSVIWIGILALVIVDHFHLELQALFILISRLIT